MNADDYAALSVARLLELFTDASRQVGLGRRYADISNRSKTPSAPPRKPPDQRYAELTQGVTAAWTIGGILRARGAIAEIKGLFDDDDPDVRYQAARLFDDIDPEAASAAAHSFYAELPTREVLALRRRARTAPPDRPTLKEMSDDALVARFEDAASRQGAGQFLDPIDDPEDQEAQNRVKIEVADVLAELKARGLLPRLMPLLTHPDLTVRFRAAQGCLRLAEQQAVAALESVVANGKFDEALSGRNCLDHWRNGKSLIDGL